PEAAWSRPGLTSIAPDLEALISAALDAALAEAGGEADAGSETVVGHQLVERGSTVAAGLS
ncbi:MAG: LacI family transcriptional regulator, partial [Actinomycetales bacterium]|nr:LacI family transcriptional regulator [Actinomycetales bacterium]